VSVRLRWCVSRTRAAHDVLDGRVDLTPRDPQDWLGEMTSMLVRIHNTNIEARWPSRGSVPQSNCAGVVEAARSWREAFALVEESPPVSAPCLIHHDYQQFQSLVAKRSAHGCRRLGLWILWPARNRRRTPSTQSQRALFKCTRSTVSRSLEATSGGPSNAGGTWRDS